MLHEWLQLFFDVRSNFRWCTLYILFAWSLQQTCDQEQICLDTDVTVNRRCLKLGTKKCYRVAIRSIKYTEHLKLIDTVHTNIRMGLQFLSGAIAQSDVRAARTKSVKSSFSI